MRSMPPVESGEWLDHRDEKELKQLAMAIRDTRLALESMMQAAEKCEVACRVAHKDHQAVFWRNLANQIDASLHDACLKWHEDKCLEAIGYIKR